MVSEKVKGNMAFMGQQWALCSACHPGGSFCRLSKASSPQNRVSPERVSMELGFGDDTLASVPQCPKATSVKSGSSPHKVSGKEPLHPE